MSEETTRLPLAIPPLKDLLYEQCGYDVPANFTRDFVALHDHDWRRADRDWEDILILVLDTDAVHPRATGGKAIKQAVEAAAAYLTDAKFWPWCPICRRGTARQARGQVDEQ